MPSKITSIKAYFVVYSYIDSFSTLKAKRTPWYVHSGPHFDVDGPKAKDDAEYLLRSHLHYQKLRVKLIEVEWPAKEVEDV